MIRKSKLENIEVLRLIGLFFIIAAHAKDDGFFIATPLLGSIFDSLARFAVPAFFLISGYFLKESYLQSPRQYLTYGAQRILLPYTTWFLIYNFPWLIRLDFLHLNAWRKLLFHWAIKGGDGYHLWFLPAIFTGTLIVCSLHALPRRVKWILFSTLYVIGIFIYQFYADVPSWVTRNGVIFAPLFIFAGTEFKKYDWGHRLQPAQAKGIFMVGLLIHLCESFLLPRNGSPGVDLGLGVVPYALGSFLVCLVLPTRESLSKYVAPLGTYVLTAYCAHVLWFPALHYVIREPAYWTGSVAVVIILVLSLLTSRVLAPIPFGLLGGTPARRR